MKARLILAAGLVALMAPAANAQAIQRGVKEGAAVGNRAAGPVGAAVGSVLGGAAYGFRSGASTVLGIPEETGSVKGNRTSRKKRVVRR